MVDIGKMHMTLWSLVIIVKYILRITRNHVVIDCVLKLSFQHVLMLHKRVDIRYGLYVTCQ